MTLGYFLLTLYVALPAFVANMVPVFATKWHWLPLLANPVSEKYLGAHKTWRGFVVGIFCAAVTSLFQYEVYAPHLATLSTALVFGALAGFGSLAGDSLKSAIKRFVGIPPGHSFIPLDYIDYIVGMIACTYLLYQWSLVQIIFLLLFVCIANPLTSATGYMLGIKSTYR